MSIPFQDSETAKNLLRAFAGESQARNRYDFAANLCQKQELQAMAFIFQATAKQEQAHAKVYYNLLEKCSGQNIKVDGTYPVDIFPDILQHLRAAQHNEYQEWDHDYAGFAKIATEEGFPEIAHIFSSIADIEKTSVCPLARRMRTELKKRGIQGVLAVYSKEPPLRPQDGERAPASISYVPGAAGLTLAGAVIRDLLGR